MAEAENNRVNEQTTADQKTQIFQEGVNRGFLKQITELSMQIAELTGNLALISNEYQQLQNQYNELKHTHDELVDKTTTKSAAPESTVKPEKNDGAVR